MTHDQILAETLSEKLDQLISATKAAAVPLDLRWIDISDICAMLGFNRTKVSTEVVCRADFPAPVRLGGTSHPRWKATEVSAWISAQRDNSHQKPQGGRPRRAAL